MVRYIYTVFLILTKFFFLKVPIGSSEVSLCNVISTLSPVFLCVIISSNNWGTETGCEQQYSNNLHCVLELLNYLISFTERPQFKYAIVQKSASGQKVWVQYERENELETIKKTFQSPATAVFSWKIVDRFLPWSGSRKRYFILLFHSGRKSNRITNGIRSTITNVSQGKKT